MGDASATLVPVVQTAPWKSARLAPMFSLARETILAATALAVVSAITPLVCASVSRATSVPGANPRPSCPKLKLSAVVDWAYWAFFLFLGALFPPVDVYLNIIDPRVVH